jgi:type I restriction enzyme M protein
MAKTNNNKNGNGKSLSSAIKSITNIMRRDNAKGALQYVPELTWMLFLRILDDREQEEAENARAMRRDFSPSLNYPYRWQDWGDRKGKKRVELQQEGMMGDFLKFVNEDLIPHLKSLEDNPGASERQKVISQIFGNQDKTRLRTERNLLDVLDGVHDVSYLSLDTTHTFPLSKVFEQLLLDMGQKNNDGGQFFTPREIIRVIIQTIKPKLGQTIYDPCCGTGGFLAQCYEYLESQVKSTTEYDILKNKTFYGREADDTAFPIGLANLVLHGIDTPNLWHGNTLSGAVINGELFKGAPEQYNILLTNVPFGGKEGEAARQRFDFKTGSTSVLFLQHIIGALKQDGICGMVIDEGVLFRTNDKAYVETKKHLVENCNLWCILSLPGGTFTDAGAGVKTNLLFFTKGDPTKKIWYYDISDIKVTKKNPLTIDKFDDFFAQLDGFKNSKKSWTVSIEEIKKKNYDLKAVNPNAEDTSDKRTPAELIEIIEECQKEIADGLSLLKKKHNSV